MFPTELLAKPLKHFYMTRQAQCSNSIYGVLSWSIRKEEKGLIVEVSVCVCVHSSGCQCVCDMSLLDRVTPVVVHIVLRYTPSCHCDQL